jgi:hypothetical protein
MERRFYLWEYPMCLHIFKPFTLGLFVTRRLVVDLAGRVGVAGALGARGVRLIGGSGRLSRIWGVDAWFGLQRRR